MKRLSPNQTTTLILLARKAFAHVISQAGARGEVVHDSKVSFDEFRRAEVMTAVGKPGLSRCVNSDYPAVAARFATLAGEDGAAMNYLLREASDHKRQIQVVIQRALDAADLPLEYAESIALDRWKRPIEDLSDRQIEMLLYTVKSRINNRRHADKPSPDNVMDLKTCN